MRRVWMLFVVVGMLVAAPGCVAVSAKHNRLGCECQIVSASTGERIFIVNTKTGAIREIDVSEARPFTPANEPESIGGNESD